ncbi:36492_t:CDS:1, partial [Racocetra persica]
FYFFGPPFVNSCSPSIRIENCQHREILVLPPNLDNLLSLVYYDPDSDSFSEDEWYSYLDFGTLKVETDSFDSNADD